MSVASGSGSPSSFVLSVLLYPDFSCVYQRIVDVKLSRISWTFESGIPVWIENLIIVLPHGGSRTAASPSTERHFPRDILVVHVPFEMTGLNHGFPGQFVFPSSNRHKVSQFRCNVFCTTLFVF